MAPTTHAHEYPPLRIKLATAKGYVEVPKGAIFDASYPDSLNRRGRLQEGGRVCPALTASGIEYLWIYVG